jgi:hypothetical protein
MIRPWSEIVLHYRALGAGGQGMLPLVEAIEGSRYASMLYGWTSVLDLCIVQAPCTYPYDGPYLRISPHGDGTVEFRYVDTLVAERQWQRIVEHEDAFRRLELFMDQLRWIGSECHSA